jgi:exo-beta-1,3-glucanase (GH17 family)
MTTTMTTTASSTNYWTATAIATTTVSNPDTTDSLRAAGPYNFKLTPEERRVKSGQHKFGLCDSCDAGLNDRADFHCHFNETKMTLTCNACDSYFSGGDAS